MILGHLTPLSGFDLARNIWILKLYKVKISYLFGSFLHFQYFDNLIYLSNDINVMVNFNPGKYMKKMF